MGARANGAGGLILLVLIGCSSGGTCMSGASWEGLALACCCGCCSSSDDLLLSCSDVCCVFAAWSSCSVCCFCCCSSSSSLYSMPSVSVSLSDSKRMITLSISDRMCRWPGAWACMPNEREGIRRPEHEVDET